MISDADQRFRKLVVKHDGNQKAVAEEMGISQSAVSKRVGTQKHAGWWASFKRDRTLSRRGAAKTRYKVGRRERDLTSPDDKARARRPLEKTDDKLECSHCGEMKADEKFTTSKQPKRRGRHRKCKECVNRDHSKNVDVDPIRASWLGHRQSSKKRGLTSTITLDDFRDLAAETRCRMCFREVTRYRGKVHKPDMHTLDRINSSMGYHPGNVGVLCGQCNWKKNNLDLQDVFALARYMTSEKDRNFLMLVTEER